MYATALLDIGIGHNGPPPNPDLDHLEAAVDFVRLNYLRMRAWETGDDEDFVQDFTWPALHVLGAAALRVCPPGTKTFLGQLCDQLRGELADDVDPNTTAVRLDIFHYLDDVGVEEALIREEYEWPSI